MSLRFLVPVAAAVLVASCGGHTAVTPTTTLAKTTTAATTTTAMPLAISTTTTTAGSTTSHTSPPLLEETVFGLIEQAEPLAGYSVLGQPGGILLGPLTVTIDSRDLTVPANTFVDRGCRDLLFVALSNPQPCVVQALVGQNSTITRLWVFRATENAGGLDVMWPGFVEGAGPTSVVLQWGLELQVKDGVAFVCGGQTVFELPDHPGPTVLYGFDISPTTGAVQRMECIPSW
jgi:hypothetical protein